MNRRLITAALVGSLGGFVFGYDLGALSASTPNLRAQWHLSPAVLGLTVSASLWGTVCGALFSGQVADRVRRRHLIAGCCLLYALAAIGIAVPTRFWWVVVPAMRFLCGMAIAGLTVACPLYLAEISPAKLRGRVVGLFQVQVGIGVLAGFSIGSLLARTVAPDLQWRWTLGLGALPAILLFLLLRFEFMAEPARETVRRSVAGIAERPGTPRFFCRENRRPILLATSIAIFNQLSGINVLLLYLLDVLSSAGLGYLLSHTYTVCISSISLGVNLAGMAFVDRAGRRPLLLWGSAGLAICLFALGWAIPHHLGPLFYLSILVAYHSFFALSQGTVVWVYLSELFPPGIRGQGQGYGSSVNWLANAILISIFPTLQHASPIRAFYFFAVTMVVQVIVVRVWYPETKGRALGLMASEAANERRLA